LSCDTFYYTLANKLGIDTMARYANSVGIGVKTGVDLPDEQEGVMPSEAWKMKTQHDKWYAGETISVGIGQGAIEVTPLQLARAIGGIASGGVLRRPHVVFPDEVKPDFLDALHAEFPGSGDKTVPMTADNWQIITDDMAGVTGPGGTAASAHMESIDFAGKTGTAQVMSHDALSKTNKGHNTLPNSWFVGIAPRRNPDIVVAVLWEHGNGGFNSSKLAAQVINAYVTKQRSRAGNLVKVAESNKPAQQPAPAPPSATPQASSQPADDRTARVARPNTGR
jgi:penicillin-binding protein 2